MQDYGIKLHDIKPLMEIQEYSLYYFIALCLLTLVLIIGLVYLLSLWLKNKNKFNLKEEHLKLLKNIDFSDSKKAAYDITFYACSFKDDNEELNSLYVTLQENLEAYKYKKRVDSFDDESMKLYKNYIEMIDAR